MAKSFIRGLFCGALFLLLVDILILHQVLWCAHYGGVITGVSVRSTPTVADIGGASFRSGRILCWILTSPKTKKRAELVKKTWGQRCDTLLFMSSQNDSSLPAVALPIDDTYEKLWAKTQSALKYIYDHHLDDAEWFFKADDDTYAIMENLRKMLATANSSAPLFVGHRFSDPQLEYGYYSGGAGYLLTREAIRRFIELGYENNFPMCKPVEAGAEDLELGRCLQNMEVVFGDTRDRFGRERFIAQPTVDHFGEPNEWMLEHEYYHTPYGLGKYISDEPITFHYVKDEHILLYEYFVYHLKSPVPAMSQRN